MTGNGSWPLGPTHDLPGLMGELRRLGVGDHQIFFDSRDPDEVSNVHAGSRIRSGPWGTLVRAVRIDAEPEPRVTIFLNMGLFSAASPLPSYFQRLLGERDVGENLALVLRALDDGLLRARVRAECRDFLRGSRWEEHFDEALVGGSPRYVDRLFRRVFPELRVAVGWRRVPRTLGIDRVALGSATLGSCAFDGRGVFLGQGLDVTLTAPYALDGATDHGAATRRSTWVQEAKSRLGRYVLPRFRRHPVALSVRLRILERASESRIGVARVDEDAVPVAAPPFSVVLYQGMGQVAPGGAVGAARGASQGR